MMDYLKKVKNVKQIADKKMRERLRTLNYSNDVLRAFDLVYVPHSESDIIPIGMVLMDIAWQISGNIPSEAELANAFFPIQCFFLGTVYQDDLLDSLRTEKSRNLVDTLGIPTCLIMGNILYCEGLLSLLETTSYKDDNKTRGFMDSAERMVRDIMESEIKRRNYVRKILPSKAFSRMWHRLTPNRACIEIGGILGDSDKEKVQEMVKIGSNISLTRRITKEISEMYGLRGPLEEKLRNKPSPLPVSLAYEAGTISEKERIEQSIENLGSLKSIENESETTTENIDILIDVVSKYDSIAAALSIQSEIIKETKGLIHHVANPEHSDVLNNLLGSEFHNCKESEKGR
ncbi:MAG: hypothetical protein ACFFE8_08415 [Candidatus Heimdallarchaeota archaeon]